MEPSQSFFPSISRRFPRKAYNRKKLYSSLPRSMLSRISARIQPSYGQQQPTDAKLPSRPHSQRDPIIQLSPRSTSYEIPLQDNLQGPAATSLSPLNIKPKHSSPSPSPSLSLSLPLSPPFQASHLGSGPATTRNWAYVIKAQLSNHMFQEEILRAAIDTQCEGFGLLSYDAWERLSRHSNRLLVPCPGKTIHPLQSESDDQGQIPVIGIAGHVEWHFLHGLRTYISNFPVIHMGKYDVIIGKKAIQKYNLIRSEVDITPFDQFEVKKSPASEETKTRNEMRNETIDETTNKTINKTINETVHETVHETREETYLPMDHLDATATNSGFDSGCRSMSNTVLKNGQQDDDKNSIRSILSNASRVRLPPQEGEQLISAFIGDLCQDIAFRGVLSSTHDQISAHLPDLLKTFTLRLKESVHSEAERNAKEFFRQQRK
jgi:hypothetical protein